MNSQPSFYVPSLLFVANSVSGVKNWSSRLVCLSLIVLAGPVFSEEPGSGVVEPVQTSQETKQKEFPFLQFLQQSPSPTLICYSIKDLDPRDPNQHHVLRSSSIEADLRRLNEAFDGLVLYGYDEASTPRVVALAERVGFDAVLLAIWDPKSADEVDGVARLARQYHEQMKIGIIVGNEGITFNRYEAVDVEMAAERLRGHIPATIPLGTSEPLDGYQADFPHEFGDFVAPNIHPFFHFPQADAAEAAEWTRKEARKIAARAKKPVLLKETGFPHGTEGHSAEKQKAFWAAYTEPGIFESSDGDEAGWISYAVAFEAFDLPWKASASGLPVEAFWGLCTTDRSTLPAWQVWLELANTYRATKN